MKQKIYNKVKENPLASILILALGIRVIYLFVNQSLWWDSHIYIGMGKYIFSGGEIGIWESFRPLVHPILLGTLWKLGFNPIIAGKVLDLLLSLGIIYLTFKIGEEAFNEKVGLIAALIVSISPLFVMFTGIILSDPLSIAFALGGIYIIIKAKKSFQFGIGGILLALSFLTRFPNGLFIVAVGTMLLFRKQSIVTKIKQLFSLTIGFVIPIIPFLVFNYHTYPNMFEPFISGSWIVTTATWLYGTGYFYYFTEFFLRFPIYLFSIYYVVDFIKNKGYKDENKVLMVLIPVLFIIYFTFFVPRKEVRYLVQILPFLAILAGYSIRSIYIKLVKERNAIINPNGFKIIIAILLIIYIPVGLSFEVNENFLPQVKEIIIDEGIQGTIIASGPRLVSYVDNDIILLSSMYYATDILNEHVQNAELFYISTCDLPCPPNDIECIKERDDLFKSIKKHATVAREENIKNCSILIATR